MLVRYIWDLNLKEGDRLPPYKSLRTTLGLGDATINRAVRSLEQSGVLETVRTVGTYVVDPDADGHLGRIIGLAALRSGDVQLGPFYSCLLHYLQTHLREVGCQTRVFYQKPTMENTVNLDHFPGLERSVNHKEIDSVILTSNLDKSSWQKLEAATMYPCFVGAPTPSPRGVFIDLKDVTRAMVRDLIDRGCRRPALAIPPGSVHGLFLPVFREALKGVKDVDPEQLYFSGIAIQGGREIAEQIMAMDPSARPDGIAIVDDQIGIGLANHLVREMPGYSPRLACMVNKQVPVDFPFKDVNYFEIDINELAESAIGMTIQLLRRGETQSERIWVAPQRCGAVGVL